MDPISICGYISHHSEAGLTHRPPAAISRTRWRTALLIQHRQDDYCLLCSYSSFIFHEAPPLPVTVADVATAAVTFTTCPVPSIVKETKIKVEKGEDLQ